MKKIILNLLIVSLSISYSIAQTVGGGGEANPNLKTNPASLKAFQDMRFGMFIHWGPISMRGTEIGWSRGVNVPVDDYDNLYKEFNPMLFNAKEWVSIAKAAGMKYLILTTKHHDGFVLWNTKQTDYNIMNTPYGKDVLKELAKECKKQGILFGTYYSVLDWHHPDYTTRHGNDPRPVAGSNMNNYISYLKNQIKELITEYNTNIFWFDGEWEDSWTHQNGMDLYAYIKGLNDKILVNNRVDKNRAGLDGMSDLVKYAGDYCTPEQKIGKLNNDIPWESCITMCNQWAWKPNDKMKSLKECIQTLAKTVGGGGNLLFNVGPMMDGRIEQRQIDRLKEIGSWLTKNGESIYGTKGGPIKPTSWLVTTNKENKVYLHLFLWPSNELIIPQFPNRKVTAVHFLNGDNLTFAVKENNLVINLPTAPIDENNTVVVLELDGAAKDIQVMELTTSNFKNANAFTAKLKSPPGDDYKSTGEKALFDGIRGTLDYTDGNWLGFEGKDFEAVVDMGSIIPVQKVTLSTLSVQGSWIFLPRSVTVSTSEDGITYTNAGTVKLGEPKEFADDEIKNIEIPFSSTNARFVRVQAENIKVCPEWHGGNGGPSWVFIDELKVQ